MRASRLLAILIIVQLRGRVTANELAEEFEVSERTIYRDVDALSATGIPIYGDRGPGGGFQLLDKYRTRLTGLDTEEAQALTLAALPGVAAALGIAPAAARARDKLLASLTDASLTGAGRLGERFHLDLADWYRGDSSPAFLPALARALLDQRMIAFRYESWRGVRDWRVAPLGLVLKAGEYYCVGQARDRLITFRIAAMTDASVSDEAFERPSGFNLASHWRESQARFERELRARTARLRASPEGCRRIAEFGAFAREALAAACEPDVDGWRELTLPVEGDGYTARLLLGLGEEAEVLAPASLRAEISHLAASIARRHAGPDQASAEESPFSS